MDHAKAAKLIRMLSSPNEGEVLNAARALTHMGIHDVAEQVENPPWPEPVIRYKTRAEAAAEIMHLNLRVEELQGQLAKFAFRCCAACGEPFRAGRADATTCSQRCRTRLHRQRNGKP
jgi:hypothetical protein